MSLIADALKKAQSARLGRRYLAPNAAGVLRTGAKAAQGSLAGGSLAFVLRRVNVSPALLVGLGSGIFLFVVLITYFFVASGPKRKASPATSVASSDKKPAGLILTPPPSVPAVEPLVLDKNLPVGGEQKAGAAGEKKSEVEKEPEERESAKSELAKAEKRPEASKVTRLERQREASKVTIAPDLSEEVRYHFNLALFYQEEKNFPLARREYERVVQAWPLYAEAHNNLGVVYKELGMYDQGIAELNKAVALNSRYPRAYHNLGVIYQIKGDWKQAIKNYETALSLDRNHLSSYNNLGLVYRSEKRLPEAREILEKALAINPYFPQTHYNLALVLDEMGEKDLARLHYQKFVDSAGEDNSRLAERVRAYLKERSGEK